MNGKKIFVNKMIWIICDIRGNGTGREREGDGEWEREIESERDIEGRRNIRTFNICGGRTTYEWGRGVTTCEGCKSGEYGGIWYVEVGGGGRGLYYQYTHVWCERRTALQRQIRAFNIHTFHLKKNISIKWHILLKI